MNYRKTCDILRNFLSFPFVVLVECVGLIFCALASAAFDALVAASVFSTAIKGQLGATQSDPTPMDFAQKTITYASAKIAYFDAFGCAHAGPRGYCHPALNRTRLKWTT